MAKSVSKTGREKERIKAYLARNPERIIRWLREDLPEDQQITVEGDRLLTERFGNPFARFLRGGYFFKRGGEDSTAHRENVGFYVIYFNGNSSSSYSQDALRKVRLRYNFYDHFKGSGFTPKPFVVEDLPEVLFLSDKGDTMLEDKLKNLPPDQRNNLFQTGIEILLSVHLYAEKIRNRLLADKKVEESIKDRANRSAMKKAFSGLEYYKDEEISESERGEFEDLYGPVARIVDGHKRRIVHGDAASQNFLGYRRNEVWTPQNVGLVDLEHVGFGDVIFDLANLGTSHNMYLTPSHWNEGVSRYQYEERRRLDQDSELKRLFKQRKLLQSLDEKTEKDLALFYAAAVNESWKRITFMSRLRKKDKDKYDVWVSARRSLTFTDEAMGRNINQALEYIVRHRDSFKLWTDEEIKKLERLREYFANEGVVGGKAPNGSEEDCSIAIAV